MIWTDDEEPVDFFRAAQRTEKPIDLTCAAQTTEYDQELFESPEQLVNNRVDDQQQQEDQ